MKLRLASILLIVLLTTGAGYLFGAVGSVGALAVAIIIQYRH